MRKKREGELKSRRERNKSAVWSRKSRRPRRRTRRGELTGQRWLRLNANSNRGRLRLRRWNRGLLWNACKSRTGKQGSER